MKIFTLLFFCLLTQIVFSQKIDSTKCLFYKQIIKEDTLKKNTALRDKIKAIDDSIKLNTEKIDLIKQKISSNSSNINSIKASLFVANKKLTNKNQKLELDNNNQSLLESAQLLEDSNSLLFSDTNVLNNKIKNLFHEKYDIDTDIDRQNGSATSSPNKLFGGGIDVTNLAIGITDFAIERSKAELDIAFFHRFEKFLEKNPEAKILFPNTLAHLKSIRDYQFSEFLPKLRTSFYDDLNRLPDNIANVLVLPRYQKLLKEFPEIRVAIKSLATVSKLKTEKYQLCQIISEIAAYSEFNIDTTIDTTERIHLKNYGAAWKLIDIFSLAFVNPTTNSYLTRDTIQEIIDDDQKLEALFDNLQSEIEEANIKFIRIEKDGSLKSIEISGAMDSLEINDLLTFKTSVQNIVNAVDELESLKDTFKSNTNKSKDDRKEIAIKYLDASEHCIDAMSSILHQFEGVEADQYLNMTKNMIKISRDAISQDYNSLVAESMNFVVRALAMGKSQIDQKLIKAKENQKALEAKIKDNSTSGKDSLSNAKDAYNKQKKINDGNYTNLNDGIKITANILKYANFAATVVEANSSKEVKEAIETVALPPGSSAIKKNSDFNISLQMHLGASFTIRDKAWWANTTNPSWKSVVTATLPVGLSFNYGMGKGGSIGLFGSLIDVGAIAQYRLNADSTISEKIRFQNIFSPGAQISYGFFCNLPLSLNAGCQYGPGLVKIDRNSKTLQVPFLRWFVSLTVDIPAFTIFNRAKNPTRTKMF